MISRSKSQLIETGEYPRIDLLPPEIRNKRKARRIGRRIGYGTLLLTMVMFGEAAYVRAQAIQAGKNLRIEQRMTQSLLLQQNQYREVQIVQEKIDLIQAAQRVGSSTEIKWETFLKAVQSTLPPNVKIDSFNIDSETPFSSYSQANTPLQGQRIATLNFTATSSTLPRVPDWLTSLSTLPGYSDASPGSLTRNDSGSYSLNINMHINRAAFTNHYATLGQTK